MLWRLAARSCNLCRPHPVGALPVAPHVRAGSLAARAIRPPRPRKLNVRAGKTRMSALHTRGPSPGPSSPHPRMSWPWCPRPFPRSSADISPIAAALALGNEDEMTPGKRKPEEEAAGPEEAGPSTKKSRAASAHCDDRCAGCPHWQPTLRRWVVPLAPTRPLVWPLAGGCGRSRAARSETARSCTGCAGTSAWPTTGR